MMVSHIEQEDFGSLKKSARSFFATNTTNSFLFLTLRFARNVSYYGKYFAHKSILLSKKRNNSIAECNTFANEKNR